MGKMAPEVVSALFMPSPTHPWVFKSLDSWVLAVSLPLPAVIHCFTCIILECNRILSTPWILGSSWVLGPSQNLTLTLNEPKKLTLTIPPILTLTLILNLTKPKFIIHDQPKKLGPATQLGLCSVYWAEMFRAAQWRYCLNGVSPRQHMPTGSFLFISRIAKLFSLNASLFSPHGFFGGSLQLSALSRQQSLQ